jgi:uncharacterized protein (TIGR02270 family)
MNPNPSVIPAVIEQHAEEAAFLWLLRDAAGHAPHYDLADLAHLDDRVEAHIDGLRIAGETGWEICKEALGREEAGEVFATAVLAYESGDQDRIQTVLEAGIASLETFRGLVSALGWLPYQQADLHIKNLLSASSPDLHRVGIAASAIHRKDLGQPLIAALSDPDSVLKDRATRAVGQLGRTDLLPLLRKNLTVEDSKCRFAAAWSSALFGDDNGIAQLQKIALLDVPYREEAAQLALRCLNLSAAHAWQKDLSHSQEFQRLAVIGAGAIGDPALNPWLIEQMTIPPLARVAGEAFTMITGIDIAYEDLEGERPDGFKAGPTEDPEDDNVEMDADENLPWPNPELIQKWWSTHKREFQNAVRYLLGKPISTEWLQDVLRNGRQRQRAAAALELAIRQPGHPLFEVRAPGFRQQRLLHEHG